MMGFIYSTALACVSVAATAVAAAAQATAPDVGLLVGLSSGRTLWITPHDGGLQLVSTKRNLLVPRHDGFWWVGTVRRCSVEEFDGSGMNITEAGAFLSRDESTFVVRAGDTAHVTLAGVECEVAERDVMNRRGVTGDAGTVPEELECSLGTREITFVSASAISVEERQTTTEFCAPAKYSTSGRNVVTRFSSEEQIPLRPLLRPADRARLTKRFSSARVCGFEEKLSEDYIDQEWGVRRATGVWRATFFVDGPLACRGGGEMDVAPILPSSFTGDTPLPVSWSDMQRKFPLLRDAAAAPSRVYLALIAGDTLSMVRVRGRRLGETLLKVPLGLPEDFVMLRWATPGEIVQWKRVIPALREPVVLVTAPPE